MKFLLLVLNLVATCLARPSPDVSHIVGNSPHKDLSSYEAPTSSINANYQTIDHHATFPFQDEGFPASELQAPFKDSVGILEKDLYNYGYFKQPYETPAPGPVTVKHNKQVYFYAAPEPEEPQYLRIQFTPTNTKNTNVIFVKTPTPGPIVPQFLIPKQLEEEKTKVYVFVKDAENLPKTLSLPPPVLSKVKPEVFIVKYKNQEDAQKAIAAGVQDHEEGIFNQGHLLPNALGIKGAQNVEFLSSFGNDIRFGGRSLSPSTLDVAINDEPHSHIENPSVSETGNSGNSEEGSTTSNTPTQSTTESTSNTSAGKEEQRDSEVKKITIESVEEDLSRSRSEGSKTDTAGSSEAPIDKPSDTPV